MAWEPEYRTCEKCKITLMTDPLDVEHGVGEVELDFNSFLCQKESSIKAMLCALCSRALKESVAGWLGRDEGAYDSKKLVVRTQKPGSVRFTGIKA